MIQQPAPCDGIEQFLLHLAAKGITSNAQLQLATEALRLLKPVIQGMQEVDSESQPMERPAGSMAVKCDVNIASDDQLQQQQRQGQSLPFKLYCLTTSQPTQGKVDAPPAAPPPRDSEAQASTREVRWTTSAPWHHAQGCGAWIPVATAESRTSARCPRVRRCSTWTWKVAWCQSSPPWPPVPRCVS